jgi:hypothetical protein
MLLLYHTYRHLSRVNLRKNRKNPSIPSHALTNFGHAYPVHRFPHERPLVLRFPRNEDDNPVAVECLHPNVVQEGKPSSVSGGVGSVVEEDFKMHFIFPKRFVVCYVLSILYISAFVNRYLSIISEKHHLFFTPLQGGRGRCAAGLIVVSPLLTTTYVNCFELYVQLSQLQPHSLQASSVLTL